MSSEKPKARFDLIIVALIVVIAAGFWAYSQGFFGTGSTGGVGDAHENTASGTSANSSADAGPYAVIQNTQGFYQAVSLNGSEQTIEVRSDAGYNEVHIKDGGVSVDEADCANQVCVQTGVVKRAGDMIVCLPHELVVQVVNDPAEASNISGVLSSKNA